MKKNSIEIPFKPLTPESPFRTLAITCYADDLTNGEAGLIDAIHSINPCNYQIVAIKHHRSVKKEHFHILIRVTNCKRTLKVSPRLHELGITFKNGIEKRLKQNDRILETCGYFPNYVVYLLHQTTEAKQNGKAPYNESEFVTNLSDNDLKEVLSGYNASKRALTKKNLPYVLENVRKAGYELKNYDETISSLNILGLSTTNENLLKKSYNSGVQQKIRENPKLSRFCIFIEYPSNQYNDTSKVNNSIEQALSSIEHVIYDKKSDPPIIYPSTKALAILNCNNYYDININELCSPYCYEISRSLIKKKLPWFGSMIIIAAFPKYLLKGKSERIVTFQSDAIENTFVCKIENNKLICTNVPRNGFSSKESLNMISAQFKDFRNAFNDAFNQASGRYWCDLDSINE